MKDVSRFKDAYIKVRLEVGSWPKEECKNAPTRRVAFFKGEKEVATKIYEEKNLQTLQITIKYELDDFGNQEKFSSQTLNGSIT